MTIADFDTFPGVVERIDDPEHRCRIKGTVVGVFDSTAMDINDDDEMPWVSVAPFGNSNQHYSLPAKGQHFLLYIQNNNPDVMYYTLESESNGVTDEIAALEEDDTEIMFARPNGSAGKSTLYYGARSGINAIVNDAKINISTQGTISEETSTHTVALNADCVNAGLKNEDFVSVVKYNELVSLLEDIANDLKQAATNGITPWTTNICQYLLAASEKLSGGLDRLATKNFKAN